MEESFRLKVEESIARWEKTFERKPRGNDPVTLDKYLLSEQEELGKVMKVMHEAGLPEEIAYAYWRTGGLLLTQENHDRLTGKDIGDWNKAISEFRSLRSTRTPNLERSFAAFCEEFDSCLFASV